MVLSIIELLQGQKIKEDDNQKSLEWWDEKIAPKDNLFTTLKYALKNDATDWDLVENHLCDWKESYITAEYVQQNKQFAQAIKMLISARTVNQYSAEIQNLDFYSDLDSKVVLTGKIQETIKQLSPELKAEFSTDLIFLCQLFVQQMNWNWIELPVAAKTGSDEQGKIYHLLLKKVLTYGEVIPNPTFLNNLSDSIEDDFRQSIVNAFAFNREFWEIKNNQDSEIWQKANQDKIFAEFGIIWNLVPFESTKPIEEKWIAHNISETEEKRGESAGLAAAVGIYHVLLNQFPDDRVVFSARLEFDEEKSKLTGKIKPVQGILAKIKAAIATDLIDTFVLHEDNFRDDARDTIEIKKLIDENPPFRVKTLDDEGKEVAMYSSNNDQSTSFQNV